MLYQHSSRHNLLVMINDLHNSPLHTCSDLCCSYYNQTVTKTRTRCFFRSPRWWIRAETWPYNNQDVNHLSKRGTWMYTTELDWCCGFYLVCCDGWRELYYVMRGTANTENMFHLDRRRSYWKTWDKCVLHKYILELEGSLVRGSWDAGWKDVGRCLKLNNPYLHLQLWIPAPLPPTHTHLDDLGLSEMWTPTHKLLVLCRE